MLQVAALRLVPIYVVAAAIAASLAVTAIVAAWVLSARLSAMEWSAVGVVCVSLAMQRGPAGLGWALLVVVGALFIAGASAGRLGDRSRALVLGFGAGGGFGVVEVAVRLIDPIDPTKAAFTPIPRCTRWSQAERPGFCCSPRP